MLMAGPITVTLEGGDLRGVRLRDLELAQQVFVAVRSIGWDTVPGELRDLVVDAHDDAFEVTFASRHALVDEVLDWRGAIRGDPSGVIGYTVDITSPTGFRYERVGLNVVHGIHAARGRPVRAWLGDDLVHSGRLPELVGPQRLLGGRELGLFPPFDRLEVEVADGVVVDMRFEGDEFEMEDQRNYGDGSFKTYSTPLQRPGPFVLPAGSALRQSLTIRVRGEGSRMSSAGVERPLTDGGGVSVVRLSETVVGRLPPLGLLHPLGGPAPALAAIDRLAGLRADHLRVEHEAGSDVREVAAARRLGAALGIPLVVEVRATDCGAVAADALDAILGDHDADRAMAPIQRLLINVPGAEPIDGGPTRALLDRARAVVASVGGSTTVGIARDFLAEVLRSPIDGSVAGSISFALSPAVHRSDDRTLIENLAGIADEVRSAREALGEGSLLVGPVTLATRHGPYPDGPVRDDGSSPSDDPREAALFGASWLVGCIAELAMGGPDAVTIATTFGPTGVVRTDEDGGSVDVASAGPPVSPAWHLLADLAGLAGASVLKAETDGECSVLAIRTPDGISVWLASRGIGPTRVRLEGSPWAGERVRVLDAVTLAAATHDPETFRSAAMPTSLGDGRSSILLDGHAVARIDLVAPGSPP